MADDARFPVALRPLGSFPPRRTSAWEDPGDERSWHVSQVFGSLMRYYEGREPSWYSSPIRPLLDCQSVVELGCGTGLALRALRERGVRDVLGLDRWPGFVEVGARHGVEILLHDLTLPLPFIPTASVGGVLSHYVLDYVSPIGVRQALREARRILRPGGRLVVLLAAVGRGSGEEARTLRYTPETVAAILADAGFEHAKVEAPEGRNTVVDAVAGADLARGGEPVLEVRGEAQLSAGFTGAPPEIEVEAIGSGWRSTLDLALGGRHAGEFGVNPTAVCARLVRPAPTAWELQVCAWRDGHAVQAWVQRLQERPERLTVRCEAPADHVAAWSPRPLPLGPPGEAFVPAGREASPHRPAIAVTRALDPDAPRSLEALLALDARDGVAPGTEELDAAWTGGHLHAVLVGAEDLARGSAPVRWAGSRGAPVLVRVDRWETGLRATLDAALAHPPPVLVLDPALLGSPDDPAALPRALELAGQTSCAHLVLAPDTLAQESLPEGALDRVLLASAPNEGSNAVTVAAASENLRYLCERALLLRLRATSGRRLAELGRLPPLDVAPGVTSG